MWQKNNKTAQIGIFRTEWRNQHGLVFTFFQKNYILCPAGRKITCNWSCCKRRVGHISVHMPPWNMMIMIITSLGTSLPWKYDDDDDDYGEFNHFSFSFKFISAGVLGRLWGGVWMGIYARIWLLSASDISVNMIFPKPWLFSSPPPNHSVPKSIVATISWEASCLCWGSS